MPTLLEQDGYPFRFRSSDRGEAPHVHVEGNDGAAKMWLLDLELASSRGYTSRQLRKISGIVEEHRDEFLAKWHDFFGKEPQH